MPTDDDPSRQPACPRASVQQLLAEYQQLQEQLNDPGVHADQAGPAGWVGDTPS